MDLGKLTEVLAEISGQPGSTVDDLLAKAEERVQLLRTAKRLAATGGNGAPRIRKERKRKAKAAAEMEAVVHSSQM